MNSSITVKSVVKNKPADPASVQIDDKVFAWQALQQVLQQAASAPAGTAYAVTVNALPADSGTTPNA